MAPIPAIALLAFFVKTCVGRNPLILPSIGLADPHVRVISGRVYMFATHDFSVNNSDFMMRDWWVWTTNNLVRVIFMRRRRHIASLSPSKQTSSCLPSKS